MKGEGRGDRDRGDGSAARGGRNTGTVATLPFVMKFLAPESLASAIIGKGGAVISAMRTSCSAKIALTEHGEIYPQTDCRVLTAQANAEESLNEVCRQIISKIVELVGSGGSSEGVGSENDFKIKVLVPRAAVGGVIGKAGANIKQIRETSGAKVSINEPFGSGPAAEQLVLVSGTAEALEYVMLEVNKQIQLLNGETWFQTWAASTGVVPGGYGQMPMGGRGGQGNYSPGIDTMIRVAQGLPPYVMEDARGFALSCIVPNRLVGGLIGRAGAGTKEVQALTGTKIGIREIDGDPDNRSLNIAGPLANTCAAYMLMMKRYLDAEAQAPQAGNTR